MDPTELLNALANVCETAQRMPVRDTTETELATYEAAAPQPSSMETLSTPATTTQPAYHPNYQYTSTAADPTYYQQCSSGSMLPPIPTALTPTQPPYPDEQKAENASDGSRLTSHLLNPLLQNVIAYAQFTQYLDETWPEKCQRRGSAVIRSSLYTEIAESLRGGPCTSRFRYWVKKSGFFLIERLQPDGSCAACLAIPTATEKVNKDGYQEYRLVARLEDFIFIIGLYHNDEKGHAGIRKTYSMIQKEFCYLPRTAVAKFIELCDMCSYRVARNKPANSTRETAEACSSHSIEPEHQEEEEEEQDEPEESASNSDMVLFEPQTITCTEESTPMVSSSLLLYGNEAMTSLQDVAPGLTWDELMAIYGELVTHPTV